MTKRCIVLAAALVTAFTILAETVKTASQPWVTNRIAQATHILAPKTKDVVALESAEWIRLANGCILEEFEEHRGYWIGSYNSKGVNYACNLTYDGGSWLYREWLQRLGGSTPDWQYTNTASRTASELTFGNIHLARTNETWTTISYPVVYADDLGAYAPAQESHTYAGGDTEDLGIVRSNSKLVIREVSAANGQRQFRLIRVE